MPEPKVAVAGIPGAWSSEALVEALRSRGADSFLVPLWECRHDIGSGRVEWRGRDLTRLDGMIVKKMGDLENQFAENRIVMLRELERAGVLVASAPQAIEASVNRYRNTWLLRSAGVPVPRTALTESSEEAEALVAEWGRAVLKPLFTTKARGMRLLAPGSDVGGELRRFQEEGRGPFYLQEFIEAPGRDMAVVVMGNQIVNAFYRVARPGEWKTTTAAGGRYAPCALGDDAAQIALDAVRAFGLDFTSVDMVETDRGWLVYEVSAFGGFTGLRRAYGLDVASLYAKYVLEKLDDERE
ncbi:MAG: ATP-grasp family protein [Chloroflexi bacterium]|nr:ATP-grasp family protein [Chloroflexota bacterium]